jgi:hypothetical protein
VSRTEARIKCSIWRDADFLALSDRARLTYLFLLSQDDLTMAGTIPLRLARWAARLGFTQKQTEENLGILEIARFVVVDADEGEVWVRSLMRHDGLLTHPNWQKAVRSAMQQVASAKIINAFVQGYPEIAKEWGIDAIPMGSGCHPDGIQNSSIVICNTEYVLETVTELQTVPSSTQSPLQIVWSAWREVTGHPRAVLDEKRKAAILKSLKWFDPPFIVESLPGYKRDSFYTGQNEHGKVYDDVTVLLKSAKNIEHFHALAVGEENRVAPQSKAERAMRNKIETGQIDPETLQYAYGGNSGD